MSFFFQGSTTSDAPALVLTINIATPGETFGLHIQSGPFNFVADWGDGSSDTITAPTDPEATHTYTNAGTYIVRLAGTVTFYTVLGAGTAADGNKIIEVGGKPIGLNQFNFGSAANVTTIHPDFGFDGNNLGGSFRQLTSLTSMGLIDTSAVTNWGSTFNGNSIITNYPLLDTSQGNDFSFCWFANLAQVSFPAMNFDSSTSFNNTWRANRAMVDFPANMFDNSVATNFSLAFFDCALSQVSVDNILVSIDTAGQNNGTLDIRAGTTSTPGAAGLAAVDNLRDRGWTVNHN